MTLHLPGMDERVTDWSGLRERGLLGAQAFADRAEELVAVRQVASTDLALGRLLDGHRNALERLLLHRPEDVPAAERQAVADGELALGVWGAEPGEGEGPPAALGADRTDGIVLRGVKTFCSGAGLLDRAIVLVRRTPDGPPILPVLVDLRAADRVEIDTTWFTGSALRASHSHRVVFHDAPVLAILGTEGTLSEDPWISGDALRSTAVWAGGVDALLARLAVLAGRTRADPATLEALGRADAIRASVDVWLAAGFSEVSRAHSSGVGDPAPVIGAMRLELTERIRELLRLSAELIGSRGLASDPELGRVREGLDLLLLQHRLGPTARRLGQGVLGADA